MFDILDCSFFNILMFVDLQKKLLKRNKALFLIIIEKVLLS